MYYPISNLATPIGRSVRPELKDRLKYSLAVAKPSKIIASFVHISDFAENSRTVVMHDYMNDLLTCQIVPACIDRFDPEHPLTHSPPCVI